MQFRSLVSRIRALAERIPSPTRTPRLCIITSDNAPADRAAKLAEAERRGDPILEVELFEAVPS